MKQLITLLAIALSACTTLETEQQLLAMNKAMVLGLKPPAFTSNAAENFSIEFMALNDQTFDYELFSGYPREILVAPGQHRLAVRCKGRYNAKKLKHDFTITLDAEAGHKYQLQPVMRNQVCETIIRDITRRQDPAG